MEFTIQKTITFFLFILIGIFLKTKVKSKESITGIKVIILNIALPATIFIALLGIQIDIQLLILPLLALALNGFLFFVFPFVLPLFGIHVNTPKYRTARLLVPSLAPGLSCFPFVLEFLGESYLAKAAMADLGNKIFVLILLYLVAMRWFYRLQPQSDRPRTSKLKSLLLAMVSEPVNIFILIALALVSFGFSMESLPFFVANGLERLSILMTPLILLFIGLAVHIKKGQIGRILALLLFRAGAVVIVSGICILVTDTQIQNDILLILAFGLSACSFWPFAHISAVNQMEKSGITAKKTFDSNFAISILALSFPLSTLLILGILSSGSVFNNSIPVFILGVVLISIACIPMLIGQGKVILKKNKIREKAPEYNMGSKGISS